LPEQFTSKGPHTQRVDAKVSPVIGCCGFPIRKEAYFRDFATVELQGTFYQPPSVKTAKRWRGEAPVDFEFALKAWQLITHEPSSPTYRRLKKHIPERIKKNYGSFKHTDEVFEAWDATRQIAEALRARLIVFQCPPSFRPESENKHNLKRFFEKVDRGGFTFIWEPRGTWAEDDIRRLCRDLDLVHCVDPLKIEPLQGGMRYFRLHGLTGYRYEYTDEDMEKIIRAAGKSDGTYAMFNNINMLDDALRMKELLRRTP
jgi:uncharacterized protein YecE (DUF72 family)